MDRELVERAQQGDQEAFEGLVRLSTNRLFAMAYRILRDHHLAEDALQGRTGSPCDTTHALTISADARTMTIDRPPCSGDSIPVDHVLRLTFDQALDPATIQGSVVTTGG